jgi:hypothetical protein
MRTITRRWRTVLLALPITAALGFGGRQALASPAAPTGSGAECLPNRVCWAACPEAGGELVYPNDCRCCPY